MARSCKAQPLARSCGSIPADEEAEQLCDAPAEWRATHGQWCASVRPRRRALVAKDGPLNMLESCSSPISALGMGLSPKFPDAGAGSPDTKTNASTISPRISSRNMPPHLSSRIVEISVSNEGSRAPVGCGLHMRALSGGCASFPERTEGLTMRPHTTAAKLIRDVVRTSASFGRCVVFTADHEARRSRHEMCNRRDQKVSWVCVGSNLALQYTRTRTRTHR